MVITKEETSAPVAPLYRFKGEEEAVKMANDACFYSRDIGPILGGHWAPIRHRGIRGNQ